jgi:hypothetical protein
MINSFIPNIPLFRGSNAFFQLFAQEPYMAQQEGIQTLVCTILKPMH